MDNLTELKRLAEAATQGPWSYDGSYVCPARVEKGTTYVETWRSVADCAQPENTKFIAAANPATVLALIAENEALRKDSERYRWLRDRSESIHQFYLSTPIWFTGVKFSKENVDSTIDAAMGKEMVQ